ncbi:hypothetical protein [Nocardia sp. NPDC059239]|uniref:hypothetical protein n=1 Tax=Nocardia sp. NPDC059239 TaxID=3346785 RepID=UPI0036A4A1D0
MSPTGRRPSSPWTCPSPPQRRLHRPDRTTATTSLLLYDVLRSVFDRLGFGVVDNRVFWDLAIAGLVEPTSKADAI